MFVFCTIFISVTRLPLNLTSHIRCIARAGYLVLDGSQWDTQSIPLSLPRFTELVVEGAYNPASIYTDISDIIPYAVKQDVAFMFQIDTPSLTSSIGYAHPDLSLALVPRPRPRSQTSLLLASCVLLRHWHQLHEVSVRGGGGYGPNPVYQRRNQPAVL